MQVKLKVDFCTSLDEPAGSFGEHITFLADRIFIKKDTLLSNLKRSIGWIRPAAIESPVGWLDDRRPDVVDDLVAIGRNDLNALDVPVLFKTWIGGDIRPLVGCLGLDDIVCGQGHDKIRFTDMPYIR